MTTFILRFILFSGLLYLLYRLLFSRMSFFKLNRSLLLLIPVTSLLIPLLAPFFEVPQVAQLSLILQEIDLTGNLGSPKEATATSFDWYLLLYVLGTATMLLSVGIGLLKGWQLVRKATPIFENVCLSEEASGPFAFFNKIVIPTKMADEQNLPTVLAHEKAHVEQRHGFDNLYYNLFSAIFWFNPFMHFLNHELKQVHECLADEAALQNTSRESYTGLLLSHVFGNEISFDAANPFFNSSLIKTRITMIYKTKTNRKMKGLYLVLLPLLAVMTFMSCQKTQEQQKAEEPTELKSEEVLGFAQADQPPLFPGCDVNASKEEQLACFQQGIIKHIQENFKYPEKAEQENLEGKLYVQFQIDRAGKIKNAEVVRGLTGETEAEIEAARIADQTAIDMVQSIPRMSPAIKDGKKVSVTFTLPINMKLN